MKWLEGYHERKVLPIIAYSELAFIFLRRYQSTDRLDRALRWADVRIERMDHREGYWTADIANRIEQPDVRVQPPR